MSRLFGSWPTEGPPARLVAGGPRVNGREAEYERVVEMIYEGSRLHYGSPHEVDDDALLRGDELYALGLNRLAALGDLDAIAELADVISLVAQAQAAGDQALAEAVWRAGAVAIGWGASPEHEAAKALARSQDPHAIAALDATAARSRS